MNTEAKLIPFVRDEFLLPVMGKDSQDKVCAAATMFDHLTTAMLLTTPDDQWDRPDITPFTLGGTAAQAMAGLLSIQEYGRVRRQMHEEASQADTQNMSEPLAEAINECASTNMDLDIYLHGPKIRLEALQTSIEQYLPADIGAYKTMVKLWEVGEIDNKIKLLQVILVDAKDRQVCHVDITESPRNRKSARNNRRQKVGGISESVQYPIGINGEGELVLLPNRRAKKIPITKQSVMSVKADSGIHEVYLRELRKRLVMHTTLGKANGKPRVEHILAKKNRVKLAEVNDKLPAIYAGLSIPRQKNLLMEVLVIFAYDRDWGREVFETLGIAPHDESHPFWPVYAYLDLLDRLGNNNQSA